MGPVTALLDATGLFFKSARDAFPGAVAADWAAAAALDPGAVGPEGAWRLDFRCFAVADPDGAGWTLIDAGVGPADGPGAPWCPVPGRLPQLLTTAGIDRADVHTVVLTHLHEDHTGWAADAAGRPFFPRARYVVQRAETTALDRLDPVWDRVVEPLRAAGQLHEVDGRHRLRPGSRCCPLRGTRPAISPSWSNGRTAGTSWSPVTFSSMPCSSPPRVWPTPMNATRSPPVPRGRSCSRGPPTVGRCWRRHT